ncbi:MAG: diguanylate cyclase [Micromonosporaceae bacterium]
MPTERVMADVESALRDADSAVAACRAAVAALGRHTPALVAALLRARDQLRCVAATGAWHVYSSTPLTHGVVGRVFTSGRIAIVTDVGADPDYIPLGPGVQLEICAPLTDSAGRPFGVLNLEWAVPADAGVWAVVVERAARRLSARIGELGGPPAERRSEKLLRHALAFAAASDETHLLERSVEAARDVSGLAEAVVLLPTDGGARLYRTPAAPGSFAERLGQRLSAADPAALARLLARARGRGASYTLGEPVHQDAHGFETLTDAGVRTMIAIPVGPPDIGGVLLVIDEAVLPVNPETVTHLELLGAHAWTAVERLRTLRRLRERATSDPLTGLRHHGPFGERLAAAAPGKTALLAIDVDAFKSINDTYGHQVGDQVLIDLARALQSALRDTDDLFRIGGDEFVAVLEVRGVDEAAAVAERLCAAARATGWTISVGVAVQTDTEPAEEALRRADSALYEAKRAGRDQVRLAA